MLAAYGIDVLDPAVSTRRVYKLLERMPPQARRGGEQWSTEAELLAGLIDHLAYLIYVTAKAAGAQGVTKPSPIPRPPERRRAAAAQPGSGWDEAIKTLTGIPGVVVKHDPRPDLRQQAQRDYPELRDGLHAG